LRRSGEVVAPAKRDCFAEDHLQVIQQSGSVERDAAQHLAAVWPAVHYVENSLMNTLFGLAFWEQIFAPVPGAFHHAYQSVPADMYQGFSEARQDALQARFEELEHLDLVSELGEARRRFAPYYCQWVDWQGISEALQTQALEVIPRAHLMAVWRRLLFDPGENRSGFPDLIALGEAPGEYCFIEVKGPGDRLQDNQKRWLRYFQRHAIPARVAWVEWADG
jgi:VRR-NUC domain